jgi:hypothetical protein
MHFQTGPAHFDKMCKDLGVKGGSSPCEAFFPDVIQIRQVDVRQLRRLKLLYEALNTGQRRILAMFMARGEWFNRAETHFMQEVYLLVGADYLCNYVRGFVIGASRNGGELFLNSDMENLNGGRTASMRVLRSSILSASEFEKKKEQLIKAARVVEPKGSGTKRSIFSQLTMTAKERREYERQLQVKPADYQPPTLDTVPTKWHDPRTLVRIDPLKQKKQSRVEKGQSIIHIHRS